MRIRIYQSLGALAFLFLCSCHTAKTIKQTQPQTLIIFYDPAIIATTELLEEVRDYGSTTIYQYENLKGIAVTLPPDKSMKKAIRHYRNVKGVLSVNEDQTGRLH